MNKSALLRFIIQIVFVVIGSILGIMVIDKYYPVKEMEKEMAKIESYFYDQNPCKDLSILLLKNGAQELMIRALNDTTINFHDPKFIIETDFLELGENVGKVMLGDILITHPQISEHCNFQTQNLVDCIVEFYKGLDIEQQDIFKYKEYIDTLFSMEECMASKEYKKWSNKVREMHDAYNKKYNHKKK